MKSKLTTSRRARGWLAAAAVPLLALAACGGGGGGDQQDTPAAGNGTATGDAETTHSVVLRALGPTFTDLPTSVIVALDLFTEVGLEADFDWITASNAATATQGLIAGEMDVASGGTGALFSAYAAGMSQLRALGTVNPAVTFGIAVNNDALAKMAEDGVTLDSPLEERVQALKGMSIAMSPEGSTGQKYVRIMLSDHGVDPDADIEIVPNADNAAQLAAARQGRVDGFANSFPNTNLPEADGWGVLWLNFAEGLGSILPLAGHEIYSSQDWVTENPEAAEKVMRAYWLALEALQDPTDELKESIKNSIGFRDLNPDGFDLGWELSVPVYAGASPVTTQEMFDNQLNLVNFGNPNPIDITFEELYELGPAEAGRP